MASKTFTLSANVELPDDIFAHAEAISSLRGAIEAFKSSLPESLSGKVGVTHSVAALRGPTGPRKRKEVAPASGAETAPVTLEEAIAEQTAA